jgi:indolepyruvate ferredoxin oxidoreductase
MAVLKGLRHLKFLRHTPFDVFNRTAHRRREWALVGAFETLLDEILLGLDLGNLDLAVEIAEGPQKIRGFDTVKDAQAKVVGEKEAVLVEAFRRTVGRGSEGAGRVGAGAPPRP